MSNDRVRSVAVDLENSSWREGRGVRHTAWSVRVSDAWIEVRRLRDVGATIAEPHFSFDEADELRHLPRGCEYRITFHTRLPFETRLLKRVSVPRESSRQLASAKRPAPLDADEALRNILAAFPPIKIPLHSTVTEYRVVGENRLIPEEKWQEMQKPRAPRRSDPTRARQIAASGVSLGEMEAFRNSLVVALE